MTEDKENRLAGISGSGSNARYVYDGDGNRVIAIEDGVTTIYTGNYFEAELGTGTTYPVFVPDLIQDELPYKLYLPVIWNNSGTGGGAPQVGPGFYLTHPITPNQETITWSMYYYAGGARVAMRVAEMPVSQPQPTPQPYPAPTPIQSAYQENFFDRFVTFLKDLFDVKTVSAAPLTVEAPVGEVYFLLGDHLGSTTMTLNLDGSVESEMRYDAWGKTRYTSGITPTERHYTGQIEESGFGLYFYNARWYDASLGRFLQADTIIPQPGSPQGWDRFVYIYNNPINGTDPTGHEPWWLSAISSIANSLCSIADPSRNPRTAAFNNAFWDGVEAWKDVGEMGAAMVDYTANAIYDGRVEDAVRGINGIIEGGSVLSQVPGEVVMQMGVGIVTTPVRIFSSDIPEFTSAITERFQGNDRTWDVLFTGANLSGDVIALYGLGKAGMEVENFARAGREIQLGNDFRLSPFGNRTGDPLGELPHYHRRGLDPSGNTIPGQGIGRHRPWETKSTDSSFWNRW